jgi:hypothetical protein
VFISFYVKYTLHYKRSSGIFVRQSTKLAGIILCLTICATLAAPALAFEFSGDHARYPCIFLDNSSSRENTFWPPMESDLTRHKVEVINATIMKARLDAANNFTRFLEGKGFPVQDLRAALGDAETALAENNVTAFREAIRTYSKNLQVGIRNGVIDKTTIAEYIRSNHSDAHFPFRSWVKNTTRVIKSLTTIPCWIVHHVIPGR